MGRKLILGLMLGLLLAAPAAAQEPADTLAADTTIVADTIPHESHAPRNAFIKSLVLPGLGQFSLGLPVRGSFWVALRGSSYFMLVKTLRKLSEAEDRHDRFTAQATQAFLDSAAVDTAFARRIETEPGFLDRLVESDTLVSASRDLVESRTRHRQDWITYTLFFTMLDALDAYVAAHLRDFPADIYTSAGRDGSVSLHVSVPTGRRR